MQRSNNEEPDRDDTADHPDAAHPIRVRAALTAGSSQFGEGGFRQEAFFRMREGNSGDAVVHVQSSTSGAGFVAAGMERNPLPGDTTRAVASFRTLPVDFGTGLGRLQIFQVRGGEELALKRCGGGAIRRRNGSRASRTKCDRGVAIYGGAFAGSRQ